MRGKGFYERRKKKGDIILMLIWCDTDGQSTKALNRGYIVWLNYP